MKRLFVHYSVLFLKRWLIMICIQVQPDLHPRELIESHCLSLSENVWRYISSKQARNEDYMMVDALPTISKADAESSK